MREAAVPGYRLAKSRRSTKVLTSLGLLGLFLGLCSAAMLTISRTGIMPGAVRAYYLGSGEEAGALEGMLSASTRRSFAELAEITHVHLTGGSLLLFLLCHLLALCDIDDSYRTGLYITSFASFLLTFGSPWLIVYGHPIFSFVYGPSVCVLLLSLLFLVAIPLREMWSE
jgi:hypothetical protein